MNSKDAADCLTKIAAKEHKLTMDNLVSLFRYGSRVYGTNTEDSDHDLVAVYNTDCELEGNWEYGKVHINTYSSRRFVKLLAEHDVCAMECVFLKNTV